MHAFSASLLLSFAALSVLASPTLASTDSQSAAHLERRAFAAALSTAVGAASPFAVLGAAISIPMSAVAIHKNHDNQEIFRLISNEVHDLQAQVNQYKASRLWRRFIGTTMSSVTIHRSKKLNKAMDALDEEIHVLEQDVLHLLAEVGLHDEDYHSMRAEDHRHHRKEKRSVALERRQLGLILGPIATKKNKKDRARLLEMQERVSHIHWNLDRVKAARNSRIHMMAQAHAASGGHLNAGHLADSHMRPMSVVHDGNDYGRRGSHGQATYDNGHVQVRIHTSSDVHHTDDDY